MDDAKEVEETRNHLNTETILPILKAIQGKYAELPSKHVNFILNQTKKWLSTLLDSKSNGDKELDEEENLYNKETKQQTGDKEMEEFLETIQLKPRYYVCVFVSK